MADDSKKQSDDQQPQVSPDGATTTATGPDGQPITITVVQQPAAPNHPVAPTQGLDTTVEGGRYSVDGRWVDAEGREIQ